VPLLIPFAAGVKEMLIVQEALAGISPAQVLVSEKSPLVATLTMVREAVPSLLSVTAWEALDVFST
jgi:hypothetical protein